MDIALEPKPWGYRSSMKVGGVDAWAPGGRRTSRSPIEEEESRGVGCTKRRKRSRMAFPFALTTKKPSASATP